MNIFEVFIAVVFHILFVVILEPFNHSLLVKHVHNLWQNFINIFLRDFLLKITGHLNEILVD